MNILKLFAASRSPVADDQVAQSLLPRRLAGRKASQAVATTIPAPGAPVLGASAVPFSFGDNAFERALFLHTYEANGNVPTIHASTFVHPTAVLIGDVRIGPDSYIGPGAVLRGDQGPILVGARTSIQDKCVLHTTVGGRLEVGDDCQIGHGAKLHGCVVENDVLIGIDAVVLDDATVEQLAIVGAKTLVLGRARVPSRKIFVGSPGQVHGDVTEEQLLRKRRTTAQYVDLARSAEGSRWVAARIADADSNEHASLTRQSVIWRALTSL